MELHQPKQREHRNKSAVHGFNFDKFLTQLNILLCVTMKAIPLLDSINNNSFNIL